VLRDGDIGDCRAFEVPFVPGLSERELRRLGINCGAMRDQHGIAARHYIQAD
jgi:hypothetical protein